MPVGIGVLVMGLNTDTASRSVVSAILPIDTSVLAIMLVDIGVLAIGYTGDSAIMALQLLL